MTIEKDLNRIATALEQIAVALTTKKDIIIPESEKKPEPAQEPVLETPEPMNPAADSPPSNITHEELHDLCLSIVRKDRAKKNKIKEILKARNAELIKDVPESQFAELKAELEAL